MDEILKWEIHILNLSNKLNQALFGISRIAKIGSREQLLLLIMLYFSPY